MDKEKVGTGGSSFDYLKVEVPSPEHQAYDEDEPITKESDPISSSDDPSRQALLNASEFSGSTS